MKARTCVYCGDELPLERQTKLYCSDWCQKQDQYAKNRDPYSVGATGWREGLLRKDGLPMMSVEQDILELAEEHEEDKFIVEDSFELALIIAEELPTARYSNGRVYQGEGFSRAFNRGFPSVLNNRKNPKD